MQKFRQPQSFLEHYFFFERFWLGPWKFIRKIIHRPEPVDARRLMIAMMAKLADADGVRQQEETAVLEECLTRWFGETQESKIAAFRMLREVRGSRESFESFLRQFGRAFAWSLAMRANAFEILCSVALADGVLEGHEEQLLGLAAQVLAIPRAEVERLWQQYGRRRYRRESGFERTAGRDAGREQARPQPAPERRPGHWSEILGCPPDAPPAQIKSAYRKLVMMYHPDRLKQHGLPSEQLRAATERFLRIQTAYEQASAGFPKAA